MSNRTTDQADRAAIRLNVERLQDRANFQVFKARTAKRLLADIQELAPVVTARIAEIEAGRRIPQDLVQALRSIGVFRLFVPREIPSNTEKSASTVRLTPSQFGESEARQVPERNR